MMDTDNREVDEQVLPIGLTAQGISHPLPETAVGPSRQAYIGLVPMTVLGRQIPPWASGAQDPENRLDEPANVLGLTTRIGDLARQEIFNAFPLIISKHFSVHPDSAEKSGYDHN
jgi:hypothetical protein